MKWNLTPQTGRSNNELCVALILTNNIFGLETNYDTIQKWLKIPPILIVRTTL